MMTNPSSGTWPVAPAPKPPAPAQVDDTPHYAEQPWEGVVKKGNSAFNNIQVEKALKLIPEVIAIDGVAIPSGGIAGDPEPALKEAAAKQEKDLATAQAAVPDEAPKAIEATTVAASAAIAAPAAKK